MANDNTVGRARDELFSHINRCGVLQAEEDDQTHWMDETIDYLAERYPDLTDGDLQDLYSVGMRFCQPAIPHGRKRYGFAAKEQALSPEAAVELAEAPLVEAAVAEAPLVEAAVVEAAVELVESPSELIPEEVPGENTVQEG